ncbi:hypothetical protein COO60DRAFT_1493000 [Scenedesmus sp. NREL 46B-D3]|nr:hypothetical protein COO60DRAFT_1493000 [Scenedesmus sp. NREL 46B-D3]
MPGAPATPQVPSGEAAAAAAAADHAAAMAERAAAEAASAAVDAAMAAAGGGWSPAVDAYLAAAAAAGGGAGVGLKRGRAGSGGSAAVAAAAGRGGTGGYRHAEPATRQVSTQQASAAPSRQHSGPSPRGWGAEQLHGWLHASGCGEAVRAFRDQGLDGPAMAGLMRVAAGGEAGRLFDLLGRDVGVMHVGLRLRLVDNILMCFGGAARGR